MKNNGLTKKIIIVLSLIFLLASCGGQENDYTDNIKGGESTGKDTFEIAGEGSEIQMTLTGGFSINQ